MKLPLISPGTFFKFLLAVICISFISSTIAHSQSKLMEGYVIQAGNDTLRGIIRHEGWTESPRYIDFRKNKEDQEQRFSASDLKGFFINETNESYKSKKIGLLNITLDQVYTTAPSLQAKDSVQIFLQEIVDGERATLYEFVNGFEESHYFIQTSRLFTELYNYPFYKIANDKKYLLVYDDYKRQLKEITQDDEKFKSAIPAYQERPLKQFIEKYNNSASGKESTYQAADNELTFDLDINGGLENWHESPLEVSNKFTYGIGFRINLPRRFHNRYFKMGIFLTPGVVIPYRQITLKTLEFGAGSYIGFGKIRPYLGFHYSGLMGNYRETFIGAQAGISYNRVINLEVGHFANFYSVISEKGFITAPRISLHYMLNLNKLFR